jgi:hypothetical protein
MRPSIASLGASLSGAAGLCHCCARWHCAAGRFHRPFAPARPAATGTLGGGGPGPHAGKKDREAPELEGKAAPRRRASLSAGSSPGAGLGSCTGPRALSRAAVLARPRRLSQTALPLPDAEGPADLKRRASPPKSFSSLRTKNQRIVGGTPKKRGSDFDSPAMVTCARPNNADRLDTTR